MKLSIYRKIVFAGLCFLFLTAKTYAQELNCTVTVLSQGVQVTNREVFKNMEVQIRDFMNNRRWTQDNFSAGERIECQIQVTITKADQNDYTGTIQIVSSRPVYGTSYSTTLFNILDKNFTVKYVQFQVFEYSDGLYSNELTALLAYYANIILGYDYDSFSKLGGTVFFQKAQSIVNSAQSASTVGWNALERDDHNRYYLINDILDERMRPFREVMYNYHRKGLDFMSEENDKAIDKIMESLGTLDELKKSSIPSYPISLFFSAKSNEIVDLFLQAPSEKKNKARELLVSVDAINAEKYNDKLGK